MENFWLMFISWMIPVVFIAAIYAYSLVVKRPLSITEKYSENRLYKIPQEELLELTNLALQQADFKKITLVQPQTMVSAKAGISIFSWGEKISIVVKNGTGGAEINFLSVCSFPAQVADWGKNKRNAEKFFRELDKQLLINSDLRAA